LALVEPFPDTTQSPYDVQPREAERASCSSQLRERLRPGTSAPPRKQTTHQQGNNPTTAKTPTTARTPTRAYAENTTPCTVHPTEARPSPRSVCAMGSRKRVKPNPAAESNTSPPAPTPTPTPPPSAMPSQSSSKSSQPPASAAEEGSPPTPKPGGSGNGTPTPGQGGSRQACVRLYLLAGLRGSTNATHGISFLTA
jgi:hypothetical protein